jgi:hypothetical protein
VRSTFALSIGRRLAMFKLVNRRNHDGVGIFPDFSPEKEARTLDRDNAPG